MSGHSRVSVWTLVSVCVSGFYLCVCMCSWVCSEQRHAGREPGGLSRVADRRRGSHQLWPGLSLAHPLHTLLLRLLVSAHLQGLQDRQFLQLHGILLHLHGSAGHQHHPGCGNSRLGCLRLDCHHFLLRDEHRLSSGDAHSHGHVHSCGRLFLHCS